jgi:chromate reductase
MSQNRTVAVIVGSLSATSVNRKVANAIAKLAPANLTFTEVPIGDLAFYNPDIESEAPAPWTAFREAIKAADAVLVVTPEYNRTMPAVLKNAIDVGSRPWGHSIWAGKPGAIVSASPGGVGGFGANHNARQALGALGVAILPFEAYVGAAHTLFDDDGALTNDASKAFLGDLGLKFADWIERNAR